jgi:hypothetical protein
MKSRKDFGVGCMKYVVTHYLVFRICFNPFKLELSVLMIVIIGVVPYILQLRMSRHSID